MSPKHNPGRRGRKGHSSPAGRASARRPRSDRCRKGQVVTALGAWWEVLDEGRIIRCNARWSLKKRYGTPVVGDWVDYEPPRHGETGCITAIADRGRVLRRPNVLHSRREQILAANIDQLMIVACRAYPPYNPGFVDRLLIAAWREGIDPFVCMNKSDMERDEEDDVESALDVLEATGTRVIETSALTGEGIDDLIALLVGKSTVMAGLSGVGKTSLARCILGDESLRVGEVSRASGLGRHTTTSAVLHPLPQSDGALIDLPGQRMFGVFRWDEAGVRAGFPELKSLAPCRMSRCTHREEEGCSIRDAARRGMIAPRRLQAFLRILEHLGDSFQ